MDKEIFLNSDFFKLISIAEMVIIPNPNSDKINQYAIRFNGYMNESHFESDLKKKSKSLLKEIEDYLNEESSRLNRLDFLSKLKTDTEDFIAETFSFKKDVIASKKFSLIDPYMDTLYSKKSDGFISNYIKIINDELNKFQSNINRIIENTKSYTQDEIDALFIKSHPNSSKCLGVKKLKTSLTVEQLAFFFKIMNECGLISYDEKTSIGKIVADLFETEKTKGISSKSFVNHLNKKDTDYHDSAVFIKVDALVKIKEIIEKYLIAK